MKLNSSATFYIENFFLSRGDTSSSWNPLTSRQEDDSPVYKPLHLKYKGYFEPFFAQSDYALNWFFPQRVCVLHKPMHVLTPLCKWKSIPAFNTISLNVLQGTDVTISIMSASTKKYN
jgi:hypothetical protein